jgi:hypothetical protein
MPVSYPTVSEIRALEPDLDVQRFTDALLAERRAQAIGDVERICRRRFQPTDLTEVHEVDDDRFVRLHEGTTAHGPVTVLSCTQRAPFAASATTVTGLWVTSDGCLIPASGWSPAARVTVTYTTGLVDCPAEIRTLVAAVTKLHAMRARTGGIPERAERFALGDSGQPFMLAVPGVARLGMPELDSVLARWSLLPMLA